MLDIPLFADLDQGNRVAVNYADMVGSLHMPTSSTPGSLHAAE